MFSSVKEQMQKLENRMFELHCTLQDTPILKDYKNKYIDPACQKFISNVARPLKKVWIEDFTLILFCVVLVGFFYYAVDNPLTYLRKLVWTGEDYESTEFLEIELPEIYRTDIEQQNRHVKYIRFPTTDSFSTLFKEPEKKNPNKNHEFLFFVKSHPTHFQRRKTIRSTWGAYSQISKHKVSIAFIIGLSPSQRVNDAVQAESTCYQDILLFDISDTFKNLTLKTLSAFEWIKFNAKDSSSFYIIVDDDCVVDLKNTVSYLRPFFDSIYLNKKLMFCGFQYERGAQPIRGFSKLSVTWQEYPAKYYPEFCRGVMVIMTYSMIESLHDVSTRTDCMHFPVEDAMVYGILREKLNIEGNHISPVVNEGRMLVFYPWDNTPAVAAKMLHKWNRMVSSFTETFEVLKRDYGSGGCETYLEFLKNLAV